MLHILLALQDAHRLIDGDAALNNHAVGRCRFDEAAPDALIDAGGHVEGENADLVGEAAFPQQTLGGLGSHRGAGDIGDVGRGLEHVFHQPQLGFLAGIAIARLQHLDRRALDRLHEALMGGFHPAGARRPREPADLDRGGAGRMPGGQILTGLAAHGVERHQRLAGQFGRGDAVDHVDHRDLLRRQLLDQIVEPVIRDCADHHRLRARGDAILDLADLFGQFGIAAGLDHIQLHPQALRLFGDAVIDAQPVGVLHVREGDADVPGLGRLVQRHIVDVLRRAVGREGRGHLGGGVGKPVRGLGSACEERAGQKSDRELFHDVSL